MFMIVAWILRGDRFKLYFPKKLKPSPLPPMTRNMSLVISSLVRNSKHDLYDRAYEGSRRYSRSLTVSSRMRSLLTLIMSDRDFFWFYYDSLFPHLLSANYVLFEVDSSNDFALENEFFCWSLIGLKTPHVVYLPPLSTHHEDYCVNKFPWRCGSEKRWCVFHCIVQRFMTQTILY
ncbi:hypothetical protein ACFE04_028160 [Oxalis oulophora]